MPRCGGLPGRWVRGGVVHCQVLKARRPPPCARARSDQAHTSLSSAAVDEATRTELEAAAYRALVAHLRERTDVQNPTSWSWPASVSTAWRAGIAGRRGARSGAARRGGARRGYGMPYEEWKARFQAERAG